MNALWVMEPSSRTSGSAVRGSHLSNPCLAYKELFPIFVAAYLGALSGPLGGRSSCAPTLRAVGGNSVFWYFASLICDFMPAANARSRFQLQKL